MATFGGGRAEGRVCRGMQNCAAHLGLLPIWEDDGRGPGDDHRRRCGALAGGEAIRMHTGCIVLPFTVRHSRLSGESKRG